MCVYQRAGSVGPFFLGHPEGTNARQLACSSDAGEEAVTPGPRDDDGVHEAGHQEGEQT